MHNPASMADSEPSGTEHAAALNPSINAVAVTHIERAANLSPSWCVAVSVTNNSTAASSLPHFLLLRHHQNRLAVSLPRPPLFCRPVRFLMGLVQAELRAQSEKDAAADAADIGLHPVDLQARAVTAVAGRAQPQAAAMRQTSGLFRLSFASAHLLIRSVFAVRAQGYVEFRRDFQRVVMAHRAARAAHRRFWRLLVSAGHSTD